MASTITIFISGTRQAKDDLQNDEACSVGEILVLADDEPSAFKRPSRGQPKSHFLFAKRNSK